MIQRLTQIYGTNGIRAVKPCDEKILKDGGKTLQGVEMLAFANDLDGDNWSKQKSLFMKVMGSAQPIVESFSRKAKEEGWIKSFNIVLTSLCICCCGCLETWSCSNNC